MATKIREANARRLAKLEEQNIIIIQRELVDKMFDIHANEEDPARAMLALRNACRAARVLEGLMGEDFTVNGR